MKVRHQRDAEKIEIQMTPMIDIVFQLLVFFIMTFKVVAAEGDFNIKMPLAAPREGQLDEQLVPPMKLRITANADGTLGSMTLNQQPVSNFSALRSQIVGIIGDDRGPGSVQATAEVELDCDYNLRYEYVVDAITHVSGYKSAGEDIVKLVEKIKFAAPKPPPS